MLDGMQLYSTPVKKSKMAAACGSSLIFNHIRTNVSKNMRGRFSPNQTSFWGKMVCSGQMAVIGVHARRERRCYGDLNVHCGCKRCVFRP